jgi:DNA-binding MarR family transcriptional regulator
MTKQPGKTTARSFSELGREVSDATILMHEAIARAAGLTGTDHKYLSIILRHGTLPAGRLAELTGLTTGAITGLIDRLEKQKLVKREFDKTDRRKIWIVPDVPRANKLFETSHAMLKRRFEKLISTFTEEETRVIERYFISSVEIMKDITHKLNEKQNE